MSLKAYLTDNLQNLNAYNVKCFFQDIPTRCQNYLHSKLAGNGFNLNSETSTDGEGGEYNKRSEGRANKSKTCLNMNNNTDDETYDDMSNTYSQNCGGRRSADCSSSCESQASSQANDAVIYNSGAESVYNDSILSESASITRTAPTPPPAPPPPPVPHKSSRRHESPLRPPSIRRHHKTIHEDDEEAIEEIDETDVTGRERDRDEEEEMEYKRNLSRDGDDDDDDDEDDRYEDKNEKQRRRGEESSDQDNEEEEAEKPSKMSYNKYKSRPKYQRQF